VQKLLFVFRLQQQACAVRLLNGPYRAVYNGGMASPCLSLAIKNLPTKVISSGFGTLVFDRAKNSGASPSAKPDPVRHNHSTIGGHLLTKAGRNKIQIAPLSFRILYHQQEGFKKVFVSTSSL
jgi:hypothetical protein